MNSLSVVHDECASGLMPCCRTKNAAGISRGICESVVPSRLRTRDAASASLRHFSFLTLRPHTHMLLSPVPFPSPRASVVAPPPPHPVRAPSSPQPSPILVTPITFPCHSISLPLGHSLL